LAKKKKTVRREWTKDNVKTLKTLAKQRAGVKKNCAGAEADARSDCRRRLFLGFRWILGSNTRSAKTFSNCARSQARHRTLSLAIGRRQTRRHAVPPNISIADVRETGGERSLRNDRF